VDEARAVSVFRPSVAEERWLAIADRVGEAKVTAAETGGWRTTSLLARCAFFFLGMLATLAVFGLAYQFTKSANASGVIAAIVCIAVAELLIIGQRFFGMGIEEALYLFGALALIPMFFTNDQRGVTLGCAIFCGAVAARLVNPLFPTFAIAAASWWLHTAGTWHLEIALYCILVTAGSWLALKKNFARPSTQRFVEWMSVVLPVVSYLWLKHFDFDPWRYISRSPSLDAASELATPLILLIAAASALTLALRWRQHALLLAFGACVVMLPIELREVSSLLLETKLVIYGIVVLIVALVAERRLRRPHGVTSLLLGPDSEAWRIVELGTAATLAASAHRTDRTSSPNELEPGGGSYGGGGSSGSY
jgi:uncharacterized membrane protein YgcG